MNFIDRFKNGWQMFLNSLDVMRRNKSLLLFPIATAALTLMMEEHPDNPIGVVRQSAGVISKTWGEALAGYAGLQFGGIVVFASIAVVGGAIWTGLVLHELALMFTTLALWFAAVCAFSYVMSVASQIYLCVLYRYASAGIVPQGYTPEMLTLAWLPKKA